MATVGCTVCGNPHTVGLGYVPGQGTDYLCLACIGEFPPLSAVLGTGKGDA